jgi:DNA-binding LacI/PurR family transcriptional regulator
VRWQALREAAYELELRVRRVGPCQTPTVHAGFDVTPEVLAHSPTAVIAYNDVLAIGVIKGLRRARVRVPDDVSVVGFDNIVLSEIVDPELTTVAAPLRAMGMTCATNLIAVIKGAVPSRDPIVMPVTLVVRGSTGQRRRKSTSPARGTTRVAGSDA